MDQAPHDKIHRHREIKHPLIIYDLVFLFSHKDVAADQVHIGRADTFVILSSRMITKYLAELSGPVIRSLTSPEKFLIEFFKKGLDLFKIFFIGKLCDFLMKSFSSKERIRDLSVFCPAGKILVFIGSGTLCSGFFQFFHKFLSLGHHSLFFRTDLSVLPDDPGQKTELFFSLLVQLHIKDFLRVLILGTSCLHKKRIHKAVQDLLFFEGLYAFTFCKKICCLICVYRIASSVGIGIKALICKNLCRKFIIRIRVVKAQKRKAAVFQQLSQFILGKGAHRLISRISIDPEKMKICVILRCSGKVLQSQSVLNGDQKSSLRLQISAHTLKKCLVRSFSLGKAHGILQHTVYYHIVEFFRKSHVIQVSNHDRQIFLIPVSRIIDICPTFGKLHGSHMTGLAAKHSGNGSASGSDLQNGICLFQRIPA